MKSPTRDHYQLQTVYRIGFVSYVHLRFLLSIVILLGLVLHPTSGVSARTATLVTKGSAVWYTPAYTDHQTSEGKIQLQLPQEDGPFDGTGWYRTVGTLGGGYTASGRVVVKGQLRNGFLIFPLEWDNYLDGKLMPKGGLSPKTIRLRAEDGSKLVQKYTHPKVRGEGRMEYRLEMPSERWEVLVNGGERITFGTGETAAGLRIKWRMRMEIEVENGKYKSGTGIVTIQGLDSYSHPPGFWTCRPLSGRYSWGKYKFASNTFTHPVFDVEGSMSGRAVALSLPENKYFIAWECYFNELEAEEFFRNKGGQRVEDRVRGLRQDTIDSELVPLPNTISAVLKDGWSSPKVNMKADSWQRIHVKRIK